MASIPPIDPKSASRRSDDPVFRIQTHGYTKLPPRDALAPETLCVLVITCVQSVHFDEAVASSLRTTNPEPVTVHGDAGPASIIRSEVIAANERCVIIPAAIILYLEHIRGAVSLFSCRTLTRSADDGVCT